MCSCFFVSLVPCKRKGPNAKAYSFRVYEVASWRKQTFWVGSSKLAKLGWRSPASLFLVLLDNSKSHSSPFLTIRGDPVPVVDGLSIHSIFFGSFFGCYTNHLPNKLRSASVKFGKPSAATNLLHERLPTGQTAWYQLFPLSPHVVAASVMQQFVK